jgi:hypothetical protein
MSKLLESGFESGGLALLGEMGFSCHGAMLPLRYSWTMGEVSFKEGVSA